MEQLLLLLSPFAPHIVEELWERLGFAAKYGKMCCQCDWPVYDEAKTVDTTVTMAVQVLGKLKGTVTVAEGQRPADRRRRCHGARQGEAPDGRHADRQSHSRSEQIGQFDFEAEGISSS